MMKWLSALVGLCVCIGAEAALVKRVDPFHGQFFEGFETDTPSLTNSMGGLASFVGDDSTSLAIQNGDFFNLWDQHAFEGKNFLGGSAGFGALATIEVAFAIPVNGFGGVFGHRVHPAVESAGETEFVFYDANGREIGRDKVFIGSDPGGVSAYWKFGRGVKRVTFTYFNPMADALTARVSELQMRRFSRSVRR